MEETLLEEPAVILAEEETLRQAAEAAGELNHIIPDLRPLAVRVTRLTLDPENARDHDPRNIKVIAESLTAFGQRTPLTANRVTNLIMKGNGTYTSAKMLQWKWVATVWTDDDEMTAMAYGLVDNRSSDLSTNNYNQMGKNLRKLQAADHPSLAMMFTDEEALPLLREDFLAAPITDEEFDSSMVKGRSISKVTVSERTTIDQAIELCRAQSSKALTEGACLEKICKEYMAITAVTANVEETPEEIAADISSALALDED